MAERLSAFSVAQSIFQAGEGHRMAASARCQWIRRQSRPPLLYNRLVETATRPPQNSLPINQKATPGFPPGRGMCYNVPGRWDRLIPSCRLGPA
jgi:hypothetical protein